MAETAVPQAPITEPSESHRRIPKAVFIENVEAWVEKYTDDALFT